MSIILRKSVSKTLSSQWSSIHFFVRFIFFIFVLCFITAIVSSSVLAAKKDANKNPYEWSGVERIVAVGDLHGDYKSFILILKGTGVVDDELHWIADKTHLVQIGDIMDRGDQAKDIFDLIKRLEEEARQAGGHVHMLLGNHEEANLTGIAIDFEGYVTLGQFLSFLPEKFKERKEREFLRKNKIESRDHMDPSQYPQLMQFWQEILDDARVNISSQARIKYMQNFMDEYGKWIIKHNAVIKINKIIFVHGGISKRYSEMGIKKINEKLQDELKEYSRAVLNREMLPESHSVLYAQDGPLWHRIFARNNDPALENELDQILDRLGAKKMIIAHTPLIASDEAISRFNGKVWVVDTGISEYYREGGGRIRALIINNGDFTIWKPESDIEDEATDNQGEIL